MNEINKNPTSIDTIIEIGPGTGLLTNYLIQQNRQIICIEKDSFLYEKLSQKYTQNNIQIIQEDALEFDFTKLNNIKKAVIANLPYNISVPLFLNYFANIDLFAKYCVLIQKEVALRLAAKPNTKNYGRLSVLAQAFCDVKICFDIPGNAFTPSTKVTSSFIILSPKCDVKVLFEPLSKLVQICFNYRRKMLRSTVGKQYPHIMQKLEEQGVLDTQRPENITLEQFIATAQKLTTI